MAVNYFPNLYPITSETPFRPLTTEEIDEFFNELDTDGYGSVSFDELEARLKVDHKEIAPNPPIVLVKDN